MQHDEETKTSTHHDKKKRKSNERKKQEVDMYRGGWLSNAHSQVFLVPRELLVCRGQQEPWTGPTHVTASTTIIIDIIAISSIQLHVAPRTPEARAKGGGNRPRA